MNTRKDRLKSLFGGPLAEEAGRLSALSTSPANMGETPQKRASSAAVKAMGLSLNTLSQEVEEARQLRAALAAGEQVVELDVAFLERSPFLDRLSEGALHDESFEELKQSMANHGQQVPVLVRPHPDRQKAERGFYQIAYGHRRVLAARTLGLPVRAVVRDLDDTSLALAQGKENAERRALSFIERAFFAKTLLDHGFDRATAQDALSVHKSEMSRLLQVTENVPLAIIRAIGPAPKVGRPRWLALGELLSKDQAGRALAEIESDAFQLADSDGRFQHLFDALNQSLQAQTLAGSPAIIAINSSEGAHIGELSHSGRVSRLTIPDSAGQGFADFIAQKLPELHDQFHNSEKGKE